MEVIDASIEQKVKEEVKDEVKDETKHSNSTSAHDFKAVKDYVPAPNIPGLGDFFRLPIALQELIIKQAQEEVTKEEIENFIKVKSGQSVYVDNVEPLQHENPKTKMKNKLKEMAKARSSKK